MMNEKNSVFQNPEIQQKMFILAGQKEQQQTLSPETKKQIRKDCIGMFFSLAAINWCHGGSLGMAWQKGLEQMESYIKTKTKNPGNPVGIYLAEVYAKLKHDMAKTIMTSPHSQEPLKLNEESKKSWEEFCVKDANKKMANLNGVYNEYRPKQILENSKAKSFDIAKQNTQQLMQQILMQNFINNRAA